MYLIFTLMYITGRIYIYYTGGRTVANFRISGAKLNPLEYQLQKIFLDLWLDSLVSWYLLGLMVFIVPPCWLHNDVETTKTSLSSNLMMLILLNIYLKLKYNKKCFPIISLAIKKKFHTQQTKQTNCSSKCFLFSMKLKFFLLF